MPSVAKKQGHTILSLIESHFVIVSTQNGISVVDLYKPDSVICHIMEKNNSTKIMVDISN